MRSFFFHPTITSNKKKKVVAQRATVAAIQHVELDADGNPVPGGNTTFRFGVSICSPKDTFTKKYGRQAALGKARSTHPTLSIVTAEEFVDEKAYTALFLHHAVQILNERGFDVQPKKQKDVQPA